MHKNDLYAEQRSATRTIDSETSPPFEVSEEGNEQGGGNRSNLAREHIG